MKKDTDKMYGFGKKPTNLKRTILEFIALKRLRWRLNALKLKESLNEYLADDID